VCERERERQIEKERESKRVNASQLHVPTNTTEKQKEVHKELGDGRGVCVRLCVRERAKASESERVGVCMKSSNCSYIHQHYQ